MVRVFIILISIFTISCSQKEGTGAGQIGERMLSKEEAILQKSIAAHGLDKIDGRTISFDFRDKSYSMNRSGDNWIYTRSFQDSAGFIQDSLINSSVFSRKLDGNEVSVSEEWQGKYGSSVNSVLYFFQVPLVLGDPAAIKEYLGETVIRGNSYDLIKVTFEQENGGEDFEDQFIYWFERESGLIDYIAYNYQTEGGGTRFREAFNRREIDGLLTQDYINWKPDSKFPPLESLPRLLEQDSLKELSRIENKNVEITLL